MDQENAASSFGGGDPEREVTKPEDTMQLLELHRNGDEAALDKLFNRYYPKVERIVRVRMGPSLRKRADVADLVQESLLVAFRDIDSYEVREDARFVNWISRIVERTIQNRIRHEGAQKRDYRREIDAAGGEEDDGVAGFEPISDSTSQSGKLNKQEMAELLDRYLHELREEWREVIVLKDIAQADWKYVAETIGATSVDSARQLHQRARRALREKFRGHQE